MFTLRPLQRKAIEALRAAVSAGHRRVLLVAPTGFGKTVIIVTITQGHLDAAPHNQVLIVVHRRELIKQTVARLGPLAADPRVTVASLQTLISRGERPAASLVLWDEAHHCPAASFRRVHGAYADAIHIGVTATPVRADNKPLGDMFEEMIVGATVRELTAAGLLVPSEVLAYASEPTEQLAMHPVEAYRVHTPGRAAVVFCASVHHARVLADEFNAAGIRAACVDGKTAAATRDSLLERFDRGDLDVITNCFVLTEGWSCDRADVCILARSPEHVGTFLQMVGRVLRTHPGAVPPKRIATVIDLRGCALMLGLPDEDRTWQLTGAPCLRTETMTALRRCRECLAIFRAARVCPRCGAVAATSDRIPRVLRRAERLERLNDLTPAQRDARALHGIAARLRRSPRYARSTEQQLMRTAQFIFEKAKRRKAVAA